MNSLSELNNYNNTFSISYTDERDAQIIFDRSIPTNPYVSGKIGYSHITDIGIDIDDIVQGEVLNIRYVIDLTNLPLASVTWGSLPSGVTASQVGHVYTLSGITTKAQWDAVKRPPINSAVYDAGNYNYHSSVKYQSTGDKGWTVYLTVSNGLDVTTHYGFNVSGHIQYTVPSYVYSSYTIYIDGQRLKSPEWHVDSNYILYSNHSNVKFADSSLYTVNTLYSLYTPVKISNAQFNTVNILYSFGLRTVDPGTHLNCTNILECNPIRPLVSKYTLSVTGQDSYYLLSGISSNATFKDAGYSKLSGGPIINNYYPNETDPCYIDIVPSTTTGISMIELLPHREVTLHNTLLLSPGDGFGNAVAVSADGNTIAVGASGDDNAVGSNAGTVYIFTRSGTTISLQTTLLPSTGTNRFLFGCSVSLSADGNTLAVGAYGDYSGASAFVGSAYIYTRSGTTWTRKTRIVASDAAASDDFGYSVSISDDGTVLAVGAPGDNSSTGSVYIYKLISNLWNEVEKLVASDAATDEGFGNSVDISGNGNTLAIGSYRDDNTNGIIAGSVYIFNYVVNFTEYTKILAPSGATNDTFGNSVSLSTDGNTLVACAYKDDVSSIIDAGSVHIYKNIAGTWTFNATITEFTKSTSNFFGASAQISGDGNMLIIGSSGYSNTGAAYIYSYNGTSWDTVTKLMASDGGTTANGYGSAVGISSNGDTISVGSYQYYSNTGRAYVYYKYTQLVSQSFNNTTKVLRLTGTKDNINASIDYLQFLKTNTTSFSVQYRYLNPSDNTKYVFRTQSITKV